MSSLVDGQNMTRNALWVTLWTLVHATVGRCHHNLVLSSGSRIQPAASNGWTKPANAVFFCQHCLGYVTKRMHQNHGLCMQAMQFLVYSLSHWKPGQVIPT